jgi:hypothetical protein
MLVAAIALNAMVIAMLGWAWIRQRHLFLLPSTWVLSLSALFFMLPALLFVDEIADLSPYTWTAMGYCTAFVGSGLLLNMVLPPPAWAAERAWTGRGRTSPRDARRAGAYLAAILALLGLLTLWYLAYVPIESTGLYGLLVDPEHSAQLREESLKLLDSVAVKYAYLVGFSCLSPLAFALWLERSASIAPGKRFVLGLAVFAFLAFYLLLTGARVGLVNLAAVGLLYAVVANRLRIGWKSLVVALVIIWLVPTVLSILREQGRSEASVLEYALAIGDRIFLVPLLISGWYVEWAETHGYAGLAAALGIGPAAEWTSAIALEFLGRRDDITIESVSAPSSFFFANYLYFGWLGLLPSLLALKVIDLPVAFLGRLPDTLARPLLATLLYFSLVYVRAAFGVTFLSHGYLLLILIVCFAAAGGRASGATATPRLAT